MHDVNASWGAEIDAEALDTPERVAAWMASLYGSTGRISMSIHGGIYPMGWRMRTLIFVLSERRIEALRRWGIEEIREVGVVVGRGAGFTAARGAMQSVHVGMAFGDPVFDFADWSD